MCIYWSSVNTEEKWQHSYFIKVPIFTYSTQLAMLMVIISTQNITVTSKLAFYLEKYVKSVRFSDAGTLLRQICSRNRTLLGFWSQILHLYLLSWWGTRIFTYRCTSNFVHFYLSVFPFKYLETGPCLSAIRAASWAVHGEDALSRNGIAECCYVTASCCGDSQYLLISAGEAKVNTSWLLSC